MHDVVSLSGRELDAAVAEKVFESRTARSCTMGAVNEWVPQYSKDWSAAALAVERMREMGWDQFQCIQMRYGGWGATFWKTGERDAHETGMTMPEAVCRAALKAREAKHA